ncbi:hypothetical protein [Streptomyces sp. NBC_01727]|uniref:hypothetical protein n=1 Tax=Streptomyces sp. NBC_01727 TaxID=2975924 RepID=UPI002E1097C8|nr:hypothetical protein OIE76_43350 [Streptomyces sp. NBC_01727]
MGVAVFARMRQVSRIRVRRWALGPIVVAMIATFFVGATSPTYQPPALERANYPTRTAFAWTTARIPTGTLPTPSP